MNSQSQPHLFTRSTFLAAGTLIALFAGVLAILGRPAWCKFELGLWTGAWDHCTSQHLLDPYTLSHVLHGIIFYWLLQPLNRRFPLQQRMLAAIALEIAWELLENSPWVINRYRQDTAALDYMGDSILNAVGDVLATILGFALASRVSWKIAVAIFVAFELWMLYVARDNLTLNILMLFFPIDAIKEWQLAGMRL